MKKLINIAFIFAIVLLLQIDTKPAHATGPFDDHVDYAPGYTYDKTKDSSYGNFSGMLDSFGMMPSSSGGGSSAGNDKTQQGANNGGNAPALTSAATDSIKNLIAKIAALQAEMSKVKTDVQKLLKDGLKEGMTDDDIKSIQELLASDPTVYPEGITTGYFGSLTKEAIKRFQKKNGLAETGIVDAPTKALFDSYLKERKNNQGKPDFWKSQDVRNHVKDNVCQNRGVLPFFNNFFCKDYKHSTSTPSHIDKCTNSLMAYCDPMGSTTKQVSGVKVEIAAGTTTVGFKLGSTTYAIVVNSTAQNKILDAVAVKLGVKLKDVNARLVSEIKKALSKAISDRARDMQYKNTAKRIISTASSTINAVQHDIDAADADVNTSDAQDLLDDAVDLFDDAKTAFDAEKYTVAKTKATAAKSKARDASDALDEAS